MIFFVLRRLVLVSFGVGWFVLQGWSQVEVVMQRNDTKLLQYTYDNVSATSGSYAVVRHAILTLYAGTGPLGNRGFDLRWNELVRLVRTGGANQLQAEVAIQQVGVERVPLYKGFSPARSLTPTSVRWRVEVLRGGVLLASRDCDWQQIVEQQTEVLRLPVRDTVGSGDLNVNINRVEFAFDMQTRQRFDAFFQDVDAYELTVRDLNAMGEALTRLPIGATDPDVVLTNVQVIGQLEAQYVGLKGRTFWRGLGIDGAGAFDPLSLRVLDAQFSRELAFRKAAVGERAANLHLLYYEKGLSLYRTGDLLGSARQLQQAVQVRPDFALAEILMARIEVDRQQQDAATDRLRRAMNQMPMDEAGLRGANELAAQLLAYYLNRATVQAKANNFQSAFEALDRANVLCRQTRGYRCEAWELDKQYEFVHQCQYNYYYDAAVEAFNAQRYMEAVAKAEEAMSYRQRSRVRLTQDDEQLRLDALHQQMGLLYNQVVESLNRRDVRAARSALEPLERFFQQYKVKPELHRAAQVAVCTEEYRQAFEKAEQGYGSALERYEAQDFRLALRRVEAGVVEADGVRALYGRWQTYLNSDLGIGGLEQRLRQLRYQAAFRLAEVELSASRLNEALQQAQEAMRWGGVQGVDTRVFRDSPERLVQRVRQEQYNLLVSEGDRLRSLGDERAAIAKFKEAQQFRQQHRLDEGSGASAPLEAKIAGSVKADLLKLLEAALRDGAGDNNKLRSVGAEARQRARQYGIEGDAELTQLLAQVDARICQNADVMLQTAIRGVLSAINMQRYPEAAVTLGRADALVGEYAACGLSTAEIDSKRGDIANGAAYQNAVAEARGAQGRGMFQVAVNQWALAERLYQTPGVGNLLRQEPELPLYAFLLQRQEAAYLLAGAEYYVGVERYVEALNLLQRALERQANVRSTQVLQQRLGGYFADLDYVAGTSVKEAVVKRVPAHLTKSMRAFLREYDRRWKVRQR